MKRIKILTPILFILMTAGAFAQQLEVMATVDKNPIAVGQQLVLTVEYSGESAQKAGQPELPDMGGYFTYLASGGTSQNISFVNGKMSVKRSFTFIYQASAEGEFTIAPVKVDFKGKAYTSQPIKMTIVSAQNVPKQAAEASAGKDDIPNSNLFIKAYVDKKTVYQGEPINLSFKLFTNISVSNYSLDKSADTQGFWVESFDAPQQPVVKSEVINGQRFNTAVIQKMALFPTSPGEKTVGPISLNCTVTVQRQRSNDIFDSFFDDPFFGRSVQKSISSLPVKINVLPLPAANKPADFSGAVGQFKLNAAVDKNQVETDEAVSLKVTISGTGNIKMLPAPHVQIPADFEQYEPKVSEQISRVGEKITGSKTFEYVLVPRFPGEQKIKPITFSYFDPDAKTYKILTSPEMQILVKKGADHFTSTTGSGLSKEEVRLVGQDIRFIKLQAEKFYRTGKVFYQSFLYILLAFLPFVCIAVSFAYRGHIEKLQGNVAYARSKKANNIAMKRLSKAKSLRNTETMKEFYAEVADALVGFVTDKLNMPKAGYVSDEVEKSLRRKNVHEDTITEFFAMLKTCDFKRFAFSQTDQQEMADFFQQAKELIVKLEKAL